MNPAKNLPSSLLMSNAKGKHPILETSSFILICFRLCFNIWKLWSFSGAPVAAEFQCAFRIHRQHRCTDDDHDGSCVIAGDSWSRYEGMYTSSVLCLVLCHPKSCGMHVPTLCVYLILSECHKRKCTACNDTHERPLNCKCKCARLSNDTSDDDVSTTVQKDINRSWVN